MIKADEKERGHYQISFHHDIYSQHQENLLIRCCTDGDMVVTFFTIHVACITIHATFFTIHVTFITIHATFFTIHVTFFTIHVTFFTNCVTFHSRTVAFFTFTMLHKTLKTFFPNGPIGV